MSTACGHPAIPPTPEQGPASPRTLQLGRSDSQERHNDVVTHGNPASGSQGYEDAEIRPTSATAAFALSPPRRSPQVYNELPTSSFASLSGSLLRSRSISLCSEGTRAARETPRRTMHAPDTNEHEGAEEGGSAEKEGSVSPTLDDTSWSRTYPRSIEDVPGISA